MVSFGNILGGFLYNRFITVKWATVTRPFNDTSIG